MTFIGGRLYRNAVVRGETIVNKSSSSGVFFRQYSSTLPNPDDDGSEAADAKAAAAAAKEDATMRRSAALAYNSQKAFYKRKVGNLRRQYLEEHKKHAAQDLAEKDAAVAATTRRRLERQRAKNERSFQNAIRQEELRRQTQAAFEDHLKQQQAIREQKEALHQRARQLLVDELEEEAHLWLTTPEEVEAAFDNPEIEQKLWARPQGVLGVPNPSLDSHFWSYEGHTWDRSKTYKTRSEVLLEELEHEAYVETNVDFDNFWTEEQIKETEAKEQKAKLRATVRQAGRRALLQRQKDYLHTEQETAEGEPPKPPPIPSLSVLGNISVQEKEGAELLLKDPTKFFVFDGSNSGQGNAEGDEAKEAYAGTSLGVPVALRDPLRTGKPQGRVFPIPIGKLPKPDMRSEKEKKRQEREERLWAAAGKGSADGESDEDYLLAEEDREIGEAIDYEEAHENWDSDDEDWEKGLDKDLDKDLLAVPREFRYRDEDLDQVIEDLEAKARTMQSHVQNTIKTMEQEALSRLDRTEEGDSAAEEGTEINESPFFDAETTENLKAVGADVDKYEELMASLTHEQLLALFGIEAKEVAAVGDDSESGGDGGSAVPSTKVFESIKGLTESQIEGLTELESFIKVAEQSASSKSL
eukprot:CAMPEP_0116131646 /NCGR_PEP_ID=MMETSP0329-20121206/9119_1 /TAXON_ID=697910 /ORGANISM="Pseudo-nitzschia arenysensis, Strain B593" /LENGTH=639 /DNA_ID=CAMNT_0003626095 /DNA_START=127 /DNA_END=2046 /DNA_ORIENTATION=-